MLYHLPITARAAALVKSLFMLSMTSKPLPSRLHLLIVPLAELIQYIFPAGKSIESPEGKQEVSKKLLFGVLVWNPVQIITLKYTLYIFDLFIYLFFTACNTVATSLRHTTSLD